MNYIVLNKKIKYDYHIIEEYDAGIVLYGGEVKSVKAGNVSLVDSFVYFKDNELWVKNFVISNYKNSHPSVTFDEKRDKKLLLKKSEIKKIEKSLKNKGITVVPLGLFMMNNKIKMKLCVVKGKKEYDKREVIKKRENDRQLKYIIKENNL